MNEVAATEEFIPHTERAAILLLTVGEESASQVLKQLSPKEVQNIGGVMASLENIRRERIDRVFEYFVEEINDSTGFGMGTEKYVRSVLTKALGSDKASGVIDRILLSGDTQGLDSLKWMDARAISDIIRQEHPQIQAIVIAYLDSELSAEVLAYLPQVRLHLRHRPAPALPLPLRF